MDSYSLSAGKLLPKFQGIASPLFLGVFFGLMDPEEEGWMILHNAAKHSVFDTV